MVSAAFAFALLVPVAVRAEVIEWGSWNRRMKTEEVKGPKDANCGILCATEPDS